MQEEENKGLRRCLENMMGMSGVCIMIYFLVEGNIFGF